jgi:hypothetical protein
MSSNTYLESAAHVFYTRLLVQLPEVSRTWVDPFEETFDLSAATIKIDDIPPRARIVGLQQAIQASGIDLGLPRNHQASNSTSIINSLLGLLENPYCKCLSHGDRERVREKLDLSRLQRKPSRSLASPTNTRSSPSMSRVLRRMGMIVSGESRRCNLDFDELFWPPY